MNLRQNEEPQEVVSKAASLQSSLGDHWLELRIALQRGLDIANTFPIEDDYKALVEHNHAVQSSHALVEELSALLKDMHQLLTSQINEEQEPKDLDTWEVIESTVSSAKRSWEPIVNKWHARKNFGSEAVNSKLKVLNTNVFDGIQEALSDEQRVIEKSRVPFSESKRICKRHDASWASEHDENPTDRPDTFDEEVYDDKPFYSLLLKTFLETKSSTGEIHLAGVRAASRRKKLVDRKASKGRKIRYKVHPKLENFTFPIVDKEPEVDSLGVIRSLFSST